MRPGLALLVFVGGGVGSVLRYALTLAVHRAWPGAFPAGTFLVNVAGCFGVGVVAALGLERSAIGPEARALLLVGVLGGFTTFSSFAWETVSLLSAREAARAALYVGGSVALGLAGALLGRALARAF